MAKGTSTSSRTMRSLFEGRVAAGLTAEGADWEYEPVRLLYTVERTYTPDFEVTRRDGFTFYVEAKGHFTSADRTKLLAVREANPGVDIRLVFQRADNRLSKRSKTTYAQWADKHGFEWAEGRVPDAWLDSI